MEEYLIYVLKSNVLAAACILLILLLARALKKKFSARWRYLAWLLTAVFLILPMHMFQGSPVIEIQVAPPPETVRTEAAAPGEAGESGAVPEQTQERRESAGYSDGTPGAVPAEQGNASAAEPASGSGVPLPPDSRVSGNAGFQLSAGPVLHILGILWAVGLVFWSVYRILTFRLFRSRIKENSYPVSDKKVRMLFRAVCRELGIKKPPALLYWEETDSPLMAGLLKPCLLLPQVWYGEGELRLIFLHELYHYKYRDLWYKTFLLAVGTLYWFNPLLWVMQRAADADLEYLCDSRVVKGMEREERMQYQRLLLKTAVSRSGQPAAGLRDSKESLKERILYMFRAGTLRSGFLLAVLLAGALAGANLLIGCSLGDGGQESGSGETPAVSGSRMPKTENGAFSGTEIMEELSLSYVGDQLLISGEERETTLCAPWAVTGWQPSITKRRKRPWKILWIPFI